MTPDDWWLLLDLTLILTALAVGYKWGSAARPWPTPPDRKDIHIGDQVRLLSGSPVMTVTKFDDTGSGAACCEHFIGGKHYAAFFYPKALVKLDVGIIVPPVTGWSDDELARFRRRFDDLGSLE